MDLGKLKDYLAKSILSLKIFYCSLGKKNLLCLIKISDLI